MTEASVSPPPAAASEADALAGSAEAFAAMAERALAGGSLADIPSAELQRVITAAVKLYVAKGEADGAFPPPLAAERITPTEVVQVVSEMMRAADLSLVDLAMWYRRAG